jgi:hypothetical protein
MKLEDFGINPKTRIHNRNLTFVENRFLGILWIDHVGAENKVSADALAVRFDHAMRGKEIKPEDLTRVIFNMQRMVPGIVNRRKRDVRYLQNHLLFDHKNIPLLSKAGIDGGYWIAESKEETAEFFHTYRKRGLTGLVKASRGKKAAMVDMMQQLTFEFEDMVDLTGGRLTAKDKSGDDLPMAIEVVDAFLSKMLQDPERFSDGLKKIGQKYGSVLLPKAQVEVMQAKAAELQELVASLQT